MRALDTILGGYNPSTETQKDTTAVKAATNKLGDTYKELTGTLSDMGMGMDSHCDLEVAKPHASWLNDAGDILGKSMHLQFEWGVHTLANDPRAASLQKAGQDIRTTMARIVDTYPANYQKLPEALRGKVEDMLQHQPLRRGGRGSRGDRGQHRSFKVEECYKNQGKSSMHQEKQDT